ncbi:MAG: phosphotransferase [Ruminococcus sp.]|nr:phosphotransferase [Ruminococcus sp.]
MDFFKKICEKLELGELLSPPLRLNGGLTHKIYMLSAEKGKYAVKLLNPYIMKRPDAADNFRRAEELEDILAANGVPVLPALTADGKKMQTLDGIFFYLFDFYGGRTLHGKLIHESHCREMGKALAHIHMTDVGEDYMPKNAEKTDWEFYYKEITKVNGEIGCLLRSRIPLLENFRERNAEALAMLPRISAVCHNDMDSKNVLWRDNGYRIIDLECLSYSSPFTEMYETALCWSGLDECDMDIGKLTAFICAYTDAGGFKPIDPEILFYSNINRIQWLEYNLKRILGIDCHESERDIGISETAAALDHIAYYCGMKDEIISCIKKII